MKVKVRCSFVVEVELPDDANPYFEIEENGCPGTGVVGLAVDQLFERHNNSDVCELCAAQGENAVIEIDGKPVFYCPTCKGGGYPQSKSNPCRCTYCEAKQ